MQRDATLIYMKKRRNQQFIWNGFTLNQITSLMPQFRRNHARIGDMQQNFASTSYRRRARIHTWGNNSLFFCPFLKTLASYHARSEWNSQKEIQIFAFLPAYGKYSEDTVCTPSFYQHWGLALNQLLTGGYIGYD